MAGSASKKPSIDDVDWNWDEKEMKEKWDGFMKFGNHTGTEITGKNFDKWLKDSGVLDQKSVTTTMTGIAFSKVAGPKRKTLNYKETKEVLVKVAQDKSEKSKKSLQEELDGITEKLAKLDIPKLSHTSKAQASGVYDRLTDTKKYTGSHKERFDETGKGKGKAGRDDAADQTGYVGSYKNKGTYDKTHGK